MTVWLAIVILIVVPLSGQVAGYPWNTIESVVIDSFNFRPFENLVIIISDCKAVQLGIGSFLERVNAEANFGVIVANKNITGSRLKYVINKELLVVAFLNGTNDKFLKIVSSVTRGLHSTSRMLFASSNAIDVKFLFNWAWKRSMISVLHVAKNSKGDIILHNFDPFPKLKIKKVKLNDVSNYFGNATEQKDFRGRVIRTVFKDAPPGAFEYYKRRGQHISGFGANIFKEFVRRFNATLKINPVMVKERESLLEGVLCQLEDGYMDISIMPFLVFNPNVYRGSYPLLTSKLCLSIPTSRALPGYLYVIRPFEWELWLTTAVAIIFVAAALHLFSRYTKHRIELGKALCIAFSGFINWPFPSELSFAAPCIHWRLRMIYMGLLVVGFIIANFYLALFTSFLSTTLFDTEIRTIPQMIAAGMKILSFRYEIDQILASDTFPDSFKKLFVETEEADKNAHYVVFDVQYAYPDTLERWELFSQQQKFLDNPLFHFSDICFGSFLLSYPLPTDSYLEHHLRIFIMLAYDMGLYAHWQVSAFNEMVEAGRLQRLKDSPNEPTPLAVDRFAILWAIWAIGLTLASVVFILEKIRSRFEKKEHP